LAAADGAPLPQYKAGQYITVRLATPNGLTTMRNYSLSDKPGQDWFRISVKREMAPEANTPAGYVSNMLHDTIEVGSTIEIAPPSGEFFLDVAEQHERPLVLLDAGIGVTPRMSILLTALETMPQREIIFIQGVLNEKGQAFKKTVDALGEKHPQLKMFYRYSEPAQAGVTR